MLKHATINRTSRAQQTLQLQRQWQQRQLSTTDRQQQQPMDEVDGEGQISELFLSSNQFDSLARLPSENDINNNLNSTPSPLPFTSYSPSPTPSSLLSTPSKLNPNRSSSLRNSPFTSPNKYSHNQTSIKSNKCGSGSMIKVFAQTLSQDVEYITLHVNTQTKSNQIIKSLLRKFRLKHRDPNLFYLTLERWIRKDGLKFKSVMLLGDEACPLQLQQCCSNPPHNDIKFTLQMRAGALVKIFCSDVAPDARYKCLSLSTQTTVEETIELMLHCLNLAMQPTTNSTNNSHNHHHPRLSGSPSSTGSSSSSNSSSSGIESEPTSNHCAIVVPNSNDLSLAESRTSSVTSISSTSNISNISSSITDQYCLTIECKDTNYKRILESDEYLVDVYQNLLIEAKGQISEEEQQPLQTNGIVDNNNTISNANSRGHQPDQWFFIKLKRRADYSCHTINFTNPRQNIPLPPIPLSISQFNNADNLHQVVSTTQIEISSRPNSSLAATSGGTMCKPLASISSMDHPQYVNKLSPPPPFILLPPIRPRRRNLSNASSTFCRPLAGQNNRRRYDPAQLAEDLNKLNVKEADCSNQLIECDKTVSYCDATATNQTTTN